MKLLNTSITGQHFVPTRPQYQHFREVICYEAKDMCSNEVEMEVFQSLSTFFLMPQMVYKSHNLEAVHV